MTINQLLFGYSDGHRLIEASLDLPRDTLAYIQRLTDAPPGSSGGPLLTGLPLPTLGAYAVGFTWSAPESPRPGAIWTHVLVCDGADIRDIDPLELFGLAKRPSSPDVTGYRQTLHLGGHLDGKAPGRDGRCGPGTARTVAAAVLTTPPSPVLVSDLSEGEGIVACLWYLQWPELRPFFAFATRQEAKQRDIFDLLVATRAPTPREARPSPPWTAKAADLVLSDRERVVRYLSAYGSDETSNTASAAWLLGVLVQVDNSDAATVAASVVARHTAKESGAALKLGLFSRRSDWWDPGEADKVAAVLATNAGAWDIEALDLKARLRSVVGHLGDVGIAGYQGASRKLLVDAVASLPPSAWPAWVVGDPGLADVVASAPALLSDPDLWTLVDEETGVGLLQSHPPGEEILLALLTAARVRYLLSANGLEQAMTLAARLPPRESLAFARALAVAAGPPDSPFNDERASLLGAALGWHASSVWPLLDRERSRPDDVWLRAAVMGLDLTPGHGGEMLRTVFGPLHHAITDDRLPQDLWTTLDTWLPPSFDPAQRLRRHLTRISQEEGWTQEDVVAALRDAGPFSNQFEHDTDTQPDLLLNVLRAFARLFRF